MSSPRLVVVPLALFCAFSGTVFALAKLHLARPGVSGGPVKLGDFYRGQTLFNQHCSACHGQDGAGGKIGPRLQGKTLSLAVAAAKIEGGGSIMPAALIKGRDESDVLAYLATILSQPK